MPNNFSLAIVAAILCILLGMLLAHQSYIMDNSKRIKQLEVALKSYIGESK